MAISKVKRDAIRNKFGGLCAYSGTLLKDDWQVDHIQPRLLYTLGIVEGHPDDTTNLVPCQRIINHYKRALSLEEFRVWYMQGLHVRLRKLPKNPKVERSIRRKEYLEEVAMLFGIAKDSPFTGQFYFETLQPDDLVLK